MERARFRAELIEGHKGVTAVMVAFDPEAVWRQKPFLLAGRPHGWLVKRTANGARFTGYIGDLGGRYFIALDERLCEAAGDVVSMVVEPTLAQSEISTQPAKARADAIVFPQSPRPRRSRQASRD